jgi:hypothetical protein
MCVIIVCTMDYDAIRTDLSWHLNWPGPAGHPTGWSGAHSLESVVGGHHYLESPVVAPGLEHLFVTYDTAMRASGSIMTIEPPQP